MAVAGVGGDGTSGRRVAQTRVDAEPAVWVGLGAHDRECGDPRMLLEDCEGKAPGGRRSCEGRGGGHGFAGMFRRVDGHWLDIVAAVAGHVVGWVAEDRPVNVLIALHAEGRS